MPGCSHSVPFLEITSEYAGFVTGQTFALTVQVKFFDHIGDVHATLAMHQSLMECVAAEWATHHLDCAFG